MFQISVHVFVSAARYGDDYYIVGTCLKVRKHSQCVGAFQRRNDALQAGQFVGGAQGFVVVDGQDFGPFGGS